MNKNTKTSIQIVLNYKKTILLLRVTSSTLSNKYFFLEKFKTFKKY